MADGLVQVKEELTDLEEDQQMIMKEESEYEVVHNDGEINYTAYHKTEKRQVNPPRGERDPKQVCEALKAANVRVSAEQRLIMLQFMEEHPELALNRLSGTNGVTLRQKLWAEITRSLNSCSKGPTKSIEKWIKSWQDWKSDTKAKYRRMKKNGGGPGEGPPPFSEVEERLLNIMGKTAPTAMEALKDPLQCQINCVAEASSSSSPPLFNPQEEVKIFFEFPENSSETPSPASPNLSPAVPSNSHPVPTSPNPSATQTQSTPQHPHSEPSASHEGSEGKRRKRKRRKNDDDGNPSLEERLVAAAERRAAATQDIAEAAKGVADAFIEFLKRH